MSADALAFSVFANSSKGLLARIILPTNVVAVRADIATITYAIYDKTAGGAPVTGTLTVADVMFTAAQTWSRDSLGYTFLWPADGTLWPDADKRYRIKLTFTLVDPFPANPTIAGKSFILAYDAKTEDPTG